MPDHAYERLATLTGLETVHWVHSTVDYERGPDRDGISGLYMLFTAAHVFVLELDQVAEPSPFTRNLASGTTQPSVLPRSALRTLRVLQRDESPVNSAETWSAHNLSADEPWPAKARPSSSSTTAWRSPSQCPARGGLRHIPPILGRGPTYVLSTEPLTTGHRLLLKELPAVPADRPTMPAAELLRDPHVN